MSKIYLKGIASCFDPNTLIMSFFSDCSIFSTIFYICFFLDCVILCSDTTSQIMLFSQEYFLRHYGGQLKTSVEQEVGENIDCKK